MSFTLVAGSKAHPEPTGGLACYVIVKISNEVRKFVLFLHRLDGEREGD